MTDAAPETTAPTPDALRKALRAVKDPELNLNVIDLTGDYTVEEHEEPDCDRCCALNKTIPLHRALSAFDGWIASMRRDSSPSRSGSPILRYTNIDGQRILKVNPVATWSRDQVWGYLQDHRLPHHPLYDAGYASIGCAPCTRPTRGGEAERAGRWPGRQREECGIHSEESCRIPAESPDLGQH
jgi:phosphoadenosine phosphosulfate reductase